MFTYTMFQCFRWFPNFFLQFTKKEGKSTANFECLYSVKFHEKSLLHQQKQKHEKEVWKKCICGEEGREWKPHLLFPSNCLALKSFIEFFPCCTAALLSIFIRMYISAIFLLFCEHRKKFFNFHQLIKHLIKYRYKSIP